MKEPASSSYGHNCPGEHRRQRSAFTLIEIMIVIVILGILASIVIAQFTATPHETRANTAKTSLKVVRSQIELYHYHNNALPTSVLELFEEGYLGSPPVAPEGFEYMYDALTGDFWVECTTDNSHCPAGIETW